MYYNKFRIDDQGFEIDPEEDADKAIAEQIQI
jgi:hypothetical protein